MTPRARQALQESILDGCKAAHPGTRDAELGAAIGCDRAHVSHLRAGERGLTLDGLVGLLRDFGATAVLGPIVALDGARVVADRVEPLSLAGGTVKLITAAGALLESAHLAVADGYVDAAERADLRRQIEAIRDVLGRVEAGLL